MEEKLEIHGALMRVVEAVDLVSSGDREEIKRRLDGTSCDDIHLLAYVAFVLWPYSEVDLKKGVLEVLEKLKSYEPVAMFDCENEISPPEVVERLEKCNAANRAYISYFEQDSTKLCVVPPPVQLAEVLRHVDREAVDAVLRDLEGG